ncbi:6533_t:CDS:2, partial [Entrophospora sp. SA101]
MVCFCNMITKHLIIKTTTKKAFKAFPGQVSFTLDAWTSKNQIPFQGLLHIGLPTNDNPAKMSFKGSFSYEIL